MPTSRLARPAGNPADPGRSTRPSRRRRHSRGIGTGRTSATGSAPGEPVLHPACLGVARRRAWRPIRSAVAKQDALAGQAGADRPARSRDVSCRCRASRGRTTHVVDPLPERVRLVAAPGELRDVELEVLGWRTEAGELALIVPAGRRQRRGRSRRAWTDLPRRVAEAVGAGGAGVAGGVAAVARSGWSGCGRGVRGGAEPPAKTEVAMSGQLALAVSEERWSRRRCGRRCRRSVSAR